MDLEVQKALLRFLDSRGEYRRLGDTATRRANVQIVCATNAALDSAGERRGKFRDDLWYRLAVKVVLVPPLRQRREDILAFLKNRMLRGGADPGQRCADSRRAAAGATGPLAGELSRP